MQKLHEEILRLREQLQEKEAQLNQVLYSNQALTTQVTHLSELLEYFQRQKFAARSEQVTSDQLGMFNEAEFLEQSAGLLEEKNDDDNAAPSDPEKKKKPRGKRGVLPASLPRVEKIIEIPESERICPNDGSVLQKIGEEVSERLKVIPAKVEVEKIIRYKYGCLQCDGSIATAPPPVSILPKSNATASLLAFIICNKYVDGLPLYRIEAIMERAGIDLGRCTMARWIIGLKDPLFALYNLLQDKLLESDYLQMDETRVQVLKEEGRPAESMSYMWVRYCPSDRPIVLFDYFPTRAGKVPTTLLEGFKGHLQADGYSGYGDVCSGKHITRLGCWDHCRRKFFDAFKTGQGKKVGRKGLQLIDKLYEIEDDLMKVSRDERHRQRTLQSIPILEKLHEWLESIKHKVPPKSKAGTAILYAINQWEHLRRCFDDGKFVISNKFVENAIRPFAIGRKNWLFSSTVDGAEVSALLYSIVITAKANGLEPFAYLNNLFEKLPYAKTVDDYEKLLPLKS